MTEKNSTMNIDKNKKDDKLYIFWPEEKKTNVDLYNNLDSMTLLLTIYYLLLPS